MSNKYEGLYYWSGEFTTSETTILFEGLLKAIENQPDIIGKNRVVLEWLKQNMTKTTSTIAGPSTDIEHEAYSVHIGEIPIYFDDLDDAVVTLVRELVSGSPLPKRLRDMIVGIQIVSEDARGGPNIIGMSADGFVTIFGDRWVDNGIIAHEIAHDLAVNKWGDPMPLKESEYQKAIESGEPPVSEYAKKNSSEDFAEAVRLFVDDSERLLKEAPLRYQVIKRLMVERDYNG